MKVLIVGGGIAGLALANLLAQRGTIPTVIEKTEDYGGHQQMIREILIAF